MSLQLYMDHHVPAAITLGLRGRGVNCLTALEYGSEELPDAELLARARERRRVLFSMDDDLLAISAAWLRTTQPFSGLIYAHPLRITIGQAVRDLELMASILEPQDMANRIDHLPM